MRSVKSIQEVYTKMARTNQSYQKLLTSSLSRRPRQQWKKHKRVWVFALNTLTQLAQAVTSKNDSLAIRLKGLEEQGKKECSEGIQAMEGGSKREGSVNTPYPWGLDTPYRQSGKTDSIKIENTFWVVSQQALLFTEKYLS
ncbi:hypothetical protein Tco_0858026 [Tanacetum coccineum]|uniref:Uncharacterized protein n=1 Tax=Tanacetum coccineum TaxID=301880 RepID=A0ABQ5B9Q7_9ASTR